MIYKLVIITILTYLSTLGHAKISVIVSESDDVTSLTETEIRDIFLGVSKTFPNGNRVFPCAHKDRDTANEFYKNIIGTSPKKVKARWTKLIFTGRAKKPKTVTNDSNAVDYVREKDGAVCFVNSGKEGDSKIVEIK